MSNALETTWAHQRKWSLAANRLKDSYSFWQRVVLALAVLGALLETLSAQVGNQDAARALAVIGAIALGLIPVFGTWKSGTAQLRAWVGARSISEELKAQVYLYLAGCGDYAGHEARDTALANARARCLDGADRSFVAGMKPDDKELPQVTAIKDGVDSYIEQRLEGQIRYYRDAAAGEGRAVSRYRTAQFALAIAAAILGAAGAFFEETRLPAWVAVITTLGASVGAALAAGRHEHLVISYGSTADRLEHLRDARDPKADPCIFVNACEAAISSQNEGWMAAFLKKPNREEPQV